MEKGIRVAARDNDPRENLMEALKCNRMLDATGDVESQATRLAKREYFKRLRMNKCQRRKPRAPRERRREVCGIKGLYSLRAKRL